MAYNPKSYRKFVAASAGAALAATAVAPAAVSADNHDFPDVTDETRFADDIRTLAENSIVEGDYEGNFNPYDHLTRGEAAIMIQRALGVEDGDVDALPFEDLGESSAGAVAALYERDVVDGLESDYYGTDETLTRDQLAKMVVEAFELDTDVEDQGFTDLEDRPTLSAYVNAVVAAGYADGTSLDPKEFSPADDIQRHSFSHILRSAWEDQQEVEMEFESINTISDNQIQLNFNSEVASDLTREDFSVSNRSVVSVDVEGSVVTLELNNTMVDGTTYTVTGESIANTDGNTTDVDEEFEFTVGSVAEVDFSETEFDANRGLNLEEYVVVRDDEGQIISTDDYQVTEFQTNDTRVVNDDGKILNPGQTQVRAQVTHQNGEVMWTDYATVTVTGLSAADEVYWGLADSKTDNDTDATLYSASTGSNDDLNNTHSFVNSSLNNSLNQLYADDDRYRQLLFFADYETGDAMPNHIDLTEGSGAQVELLGDSDMIVSLTQNENGVFVRPVNSNVSGTAEVRVTTEVDGTEYDETIQIDVKESRDVSAFANYSVDVLQSEKAGLASGDNLTTGSDLVLNEELDNTANATTTGADEEDVDVDNFNITELLRDQYGNELTDSEDNRFVEGPLQIESKSYDPNTNELTITYEDRDTNSEVRTDRVVVSLSEDDSLVQNAVSIDNSGNVTVSSKDPVPAFNITLSYYYEGETSPAFETDVRTQVHETDGVVDEYEVYEVDGRDHYDFVNPAAQNNLKYDVRALDSNGNVLTKQITANSLLDLYLDPSTNHSSEEETYFNLAEGTLANTLGQQNDAFAYFAQSGDIDLRYTLPVNDAVGETDELSTTLDVTYSNSNPVPYSAEVQNEITAVESDFTEVYDEMTLRDILLGALDVNEFNYDDVKQDLSPKVPENGDNIFSIAPLEGNDGYLDGFEPLVSLQDEDGNPINFGAKVYGLNKEDIEDVTSPNNENLRQALTYKGADNEGAFLANEANVDNLQTFSIENVRFVNITNGNNIEIEDNKGDFVSGSNINENEQLSLDSVIRFTSGQEAQMILEVQEVYLDGNDTVNRLGETQLVRVNLIR